MRCSALPEQPCALRKVPVRSRRASRSKQAESPIQACVLHRDRAFTAGKVSAPFCRIIPPGGQSLLHVMRYIDIEEIAYEKDRSDMEYPVPEKTGKPCRKERVMHRETCQNRELPEIGLYSAGRRNPENRIMRGVPGIASRLTEKE